MSLLISRIDLCLFDIGAATTGVSASVPDSQGSNDLSAVVYGKSEEVAQPQNDSGDLDSEFDALIKGKFKDQYGKRVQATVESRVKGLKDIESRYKALDPVLELLGGKYGADKNDPKALLKALEEDDSYYEDEAFEKGITVPQLKEVKRMQRENAELKAERDAQAEKDRVDKNLAKWIAEAETAKATYPNLDLGEELKNPQFVGLCESGIDVGTAYLAVHSRELVPQAMQYTAKQVETKLTNKVRANASRPTENGLSSSSTAVVKNDVTQLTKADRLEIAKRVARGEKIKF